MNVYVAWIKNYEKQINSTSKIVNYKLFEILLTD